MAWRKVYGRFPRFWELVCIFLHVIGICGRQYLTTRGAKNGHWELGALLAYRIFGPKGYDFCAGHTPESGEDRSPLFLADKFSWLVAPMWWLWSNYWLEKLKVTPPPEWKKAIAAALEEEGFFSCHAIHKRGLEA